jgi:RNA recognition motif-containing protein
MATKRIYIGNLSFEATSDEVRSAFEAFGAVHDVSLINDRATGKPKGFGFVEMDDAAALTAIESLNGKDLGGRALTVSEAHERTGGAART